MSDKTLLERARYWIIEDIAAGAEKDEEHLVLIGELCDALDLAANNILCGYCGKLDRKPEPWSSEAAMKIILEHLKTCTDHPLNQLSTFTEEMSCGHLSALLVLDDNDEPRCSQCWLKDVEAGLAALRSANDTIASLLRTGFMTCVSSPATMDFHVKIKFQNLADAQKLHGVLVHLAEEPKA